MQKAKSAASNPIHAEAIGSLDDLLNGKADGWEGLETPRKASGATIKSRRKSQSRHALSARDGRYQRSKGRTAQISTKVTPEVFDGAAQACLDLHVPKAEFYELALRYVADQVRKGKLTLEDLDIAS